MAGDFAGSYKEPMTTKTSDSKAHDTWFRAKIQQALDDLRPPIPNDQVKAHFAKRRAISLAKIRMRENGRG
jgi:hypothetical protein